MAIWFELLVMLLATYSLGLALGWLIWGGAPNDMEGEADDADS